MKTYITILIGIAVLFIVVYGGYSFINKEKEVKKDEKIKTSEVNVISKMMLLTGTVTRFFEGENKIVYNFNIPKNATTSFEMDGALVRITDSNVPYANIYFSYEGARGFTPNEYINEIIAPSVPVITPTAESLIGSYQWQNAESSGSEWHIASVLNGQWLIVVENKKTLHDIMQETLTSMRVE